MSDLEKFHNDLESCQSNEWHRREFLKMLVASFSGLALTGCDVRAPEEKVIPFLEQPENILPGLAYWYASTCMACPAQCGILVKNREGRPIKIEGNKLHPLSRGGVCSRGQASLLSLYDSLRLKSPLRGGVPSDWSVLDQQILSQLAEIKQNNGAIRIVSSTVNSPVLQTAINEFLSVYPMAQHIMWDSISYASILDAHAISFGKRVLPDYRFDKASLIVSFGADFLGSWISPVEFSKLWSQTRYKDQEHTIASTHIQIESCLTLTGSNADARHVIHPNDQKSIIIALATQIAQNLNWVHELPVVKLTTTNLGIVEQTYKQLLKEPGRSLVICDSDDWHIQVVINLINEMLGNYEHTLNIKHGSLQYQGDDQKMYALIHEMQQDKVQAIIVCNSNPVYHHPMGRQFQEALAKIPLSIALSQTEDETSSLVQVVCPDHHYLESWHDVHPQMGIYSLCQPLLAPLYNTRSATESFLLWSHKNSSEYEYMRVYWKQHLYSQQEQYADFDDFWNKVVHDGVFSLESEIAEADYFDRKCLSKINWNFMPEPQSFYLKAYASINLGDGSGANNPWLQELPDPITKVSWGNYASIAPQMADQMKLIEGRVVEISNKSLSVQLPIHIQPGMSDRVIAVALGYGRVHAGQIAANYPMEKMFPIDKELLSGANVFPFLVDPWVMLKTTDQISPLAKAQVYEKLDTPFGHSRSSLVQKEAVHGEALHSLWPEHEYKGHKWSMAIDLNRCTGCSACVVGCQVENNIPSVGKIEVLKQRDMYWMRIDRYYQGDGNNLKIFFQPMLCQHCDHAPCETVCPVLATVHSSEGLNMQIYNRCVGTRYCANNCPYKVRRFNWFDYAHQDLLQNLVLNPDVTVRSRGVMEKCSFCVQRIMEAKHQARLEGKKIEDGAITPACMQSCPTDAITFGDINDKKSQVAQDAKDPRSFRVLEEIGVSPSVYYLTRITK